MIHELNTDKKSMSLFLLRTLIVLYCFLLNTTKHGNYIKKATHSTWFTEEVDFSEDKAHFKK